VSRRGMGINNGLVAPWWRQRGQGRCLGGAHGPTSRPQNPAHLPRLSAEDSGGKHGRGLVPLTVNPGPPRPVYHWAPRAFERGKASGPKINQKKGVKGGMHRGDGGGENRGRQYGGDVVGGGLTDQRWGPTGADRPGFRDGGIPGGTAKWRGCGGGT